MAQTTSTDLAPIIPEVWEDMLEADIPNKIRFTPMARVNTRLQGQPGNEISMNWWNYIGDAEDIAETDVIVPVKMDTDGEKMTVKEAAKGVELTDKARMDPIQDPEPEARRQLTRGVAQKIDKDLFAVIDAAGPGSVDVTDGATTPAQVPFSIDTLGRAIAEFGELDEGDWADAFAGLVISPQEQIAVMEDDRFQTADKAGANATLFRGAIGSVYGIPLIVSGRAVNGARLVRRDSILLAYKRRPMVETDRDILARSTIITTNVHYGVYRATRRLGVARFAPQPA
ncbi:N4-gp56 family major capsid protein [Prauserella endophytica]|uniref:N4-gp56 family major capsid protein n=1 Tax=Prauserella endophytica TaxID=1592324 RepID=UPI000D91A67C|nr:N4-gp56 family major capsid protein [Prauserella endophytica]PXY20324.1 N4-gp56 family major capsid protein [Prauserella coralliicola]